PGADLGDKGKVVLGIRPSDFALAESAEPGLPKITVEVEVVENLGAEMHLLFPVDAPRIDVEGAGAEEAADLSDEQLIDDERSLFTAAVPARRAVEVGERLELAVEVERLHFFDAGSGEVLVSAANGALVAS
ncbi:MAG TPA: ABC transporter ATP-binding protein, partial [Solirubrobacterales bacterium]|nr:ABC transporter ATP-binding protein [Solirubrobacterales bacterium]